MNKESILMRRIEVALCENDCWVLRTNSGVYYGQDGNRVRIGFVGLSDLIGCNADGQIFFLEVKTPGGRIRPEQSKFLTAMKKRGFRAGFVHSVEEAVEVATC